MSYDGSDVEEWQERAAIMEHDGGMSRDEAERSATVRTRPPTHTEAVEWLRRNVKEPRYCRECLTLWKSTMGSKAAKAIYDEAPASVREWIEARYGKAKTTKQNS